VVIMCDLTAESVGQMVKRVQLAEWHGQVVEGHLTRDGLIELRSRLDPARGEFGCATAHALLIIVIERLAPMRDMAPEDDTLWAEVLGQVPDSPAGLEDGPPRW
jgi:hypothetical protein